MQLFFQIAYRQKLAFFRRGYSTRLLDRILFRRIASAVVGGKLRLMVVGGALLSKEVHEFTQVTFPLLNQLKGISLPFELNNAYQVNIKVSTREK